MTNDLMEFIKWIFATGWSVLCGINVPGFSNVSFADMFIALFITCIAFLLLRFYGLTNESSGGNSRSKANEEEE